MMVTTLSTCGEKRGPVTSHTPPSSTVFISLHTPHSEESAVRSYLILSEFSSPLAKVDVGLPQDHMGVSSTNPLHAHTHTHLSIIEVLLKYSAYRESGVSAHLDGGDGEGDLPPTVDVRVENTKDVLELLWNDERLQRKQVSVVTQGTRL